MNRWHYPRSKKKIVVHPLGYLSLHHSPGLKYPRGLCTSKILGMTQTEERIEEVNVLPTFLILQLKASGFLSSEYMGYFTFNSGEAGILQGSSSGPCPRV